MDATAIQVLEQHGWDVEAAKQALMSNYSFDVALDHLNELCRRAAAGRLAQIIERDGKDYRSEYARDELGRLSQYVSDDDEDSIFNEVHRRLREQERARHPKPMM